MVELRQLHRGHVHTHIMNNKFIIFVTLLFLGLSSDIYADLPVQLDAVNTLVEIRESTQKWFDSLPALLAATPTATSTPTPTSVSFAVIGDYGYAGTPEEDVANLVKGWNPDLIITTADNNYPDGEASTIDDNIGQYYADYIYPYTGSYGSTATSNLFFPSLGNHDWNTPGAQPYLDYFTLPGNERYYDFIRGPVHFFVVDSDTNEPDGTSIDSTQGTWLQAQLAASTSPWKVVYLHHAPYSSSTHGSTTRMQWPYAVWGATAVLAGHDHTYERIVIGGFPYFVNGLGGSSIYSFGTPISGSQVRYNADYGAMKIVADADSITFQFINRSGTIIDTHTINAPSPLATPTPSPSPSPTPSATPTPASSPTATPRPSPSLTPTAPATPTLVAAILESGDYDGDGTSDIAIFRPDQVL